MMRKVAGRVRLAACVGVAALAAVSPARGQASWGEGFENVGAVPLGEDGPSNLTAQGWIFRNQSEPEGPSDWYGSDGVQSFTAHTGRWVLAADYNSTNPYAPDAAISSWAILPAIPNQQAGDMIRFVTQGSIYTRMDRLQVRYSPSGGTDTGQGALGEGDFTELLLDINPIVRGGGWQQHEVAVPGPGRIAFRYYIAGDVGGQWGGFFGVDTLTVGEPPSGPYPIPEPGETVHWTASMSPIVLEGNVVIPEGGTVIIDAGVRVQAQTNSSLVVEGVVESRGTAAQPVVMSVAQVFPPLVTVRGTLEADFTDFRGQVRPEPGCTIDLRDSSFAGPGGMFNPSVLLDELPFIRMERCSAEDADLIISDSWVILRDVVMTNSDLWLLRGMSVTEGVVIVGGTASFGTNDYAQPYTVQGLTVVNNPDRGGLNIGGTNFLIGPGVTLDNNWFPIITEFGLLPGSQFSATGNQYNYAGIINDNYIGGRQYFAPTSVPYAWLGRGLGDVTIEPGVTMKLDYEPGMRGHMEAVGTPEQPIVFEPLNPDIGWRGATNFNVPIGFWLGSGSRLENVEVSGTVEAAAFDGEGTSVNNVFVHDNASGLFIRSGRVGKSLFTDNTIGLRGHPELIGDTNPLSFEGNSNAFYADAIIDARFNWWGHPTGPRAPQNPGGQGDAIGGPYASNVAVTPFLTTPPDFTDSPPVVHVTDPWFKVQGGYEAAGYFLRPGDKFILRWEVSDDRGVTNQKIMFAPDGVYNTVIADNIPGHVRSYEWAVPEIGFAFLSPQHLMVVATDTAGQEAWDETSVLISSERLTGEVQIVTDFAGQTLRGGDILGSVQTSGGVGGGASGELVLLLEADGWQLGGPAVELMPLPIVSTDAARLAFRAYGNENDVMWFFSPNYFSIRHDPRLGLIPPEVQMLTPTAGSSFPGGSVVPITWTASDADDGIYSFDIQASYDGGRTWKVVAEMLPPEARRYDWRLPASTGIPDVRARVIVRDRKFQNSTSGHDRVFSITPGGAECPADVDGNSTLTLNDFVQFRNYYVAGDMRADFDNSGGLTLNDFVQYRNAYTAGCP